MSKSDLTTSAVKTLDRLLSLSDAHLRDLMKANQTHDLGELVVGSGHPDLTDRLILEEPGNVELVSVAFDDNITQGLYSAVPLDVGISSGIFTLNYDAFVSAIIGQTRSDIYEFTVPVYSTLDFEAPSDEMDSNGIVVSVSSNADESGGGTLAA